MLGVGWRSSPPRRFPLTHLSAMGYSAAAAWSVSRRLSSAYSGPLLRVRRSSDNAEQDIAATAAGALDAAALLAFCGAGSGYVAKVYDQGGGGFDMVQATAGSQPRCVNSGALDTMGALARPAMNFVGASKKLENASFAHGAAATVNVVAVADGGFSGMIGNPVANNGRTRITGRGTAILGLSTPEIGTIQASGATSIVSATASGSGTAAIALRRNGAGDGSSTTTRGAPAAGLVFGVGVYGNTGDFSGSLSEVVIWQTVVPDGVLSVLERDQGRHFGVAVS